MKCTHVCTAQTTYYLFTKLLIEPDFPALLNEIAKPHPDMNIKVTAFKVSTLYMYVYRDFLCQMILSFNYTMLGNNS